MPGIMLVEDDLLTILSLRRHLELMGLGVCLVVQSGEDALERLAGLRPDAVLMDINLAGELDGVQTTARINAVSDVPVIYVSGNNDPQTRSRVQATRHRAFLGKPCDHGALKAAIAQALLPGTAPGQPKPDPGSGDSLPP